MEIIYYFPIDCTKYVWNFLSTKKNPNHGKRMRQNEFYYIEFILVCLGIPRKKFLFIEILRFIFYRFLYFSDIFQFLVLATCGGGIMLYVAQELMYTKMHKFSSEANLPLTWKAPCTLYLLSSPYNASFLTLHTM